MEFTEAERRSAKARIALDGPSGSGKTWTALVIAKLIAKLSGSTKNPALIDSERDSSKKYAIKRGTEESEGNWKFSHLALTEKSPQEYSEALQAAADAGYTEVICDSMSHLWLKTLELVDRGGGWKGAGKTLGPKYQAVVDQVVAYPGHVICTMRAKSGVTIEKDDKTGKTSVKKHGMEAVIREGSEFEYDLWLNLALDGTITVAKSRFGKVIPVGEVYERHQIPDMVRRLLAELDAGVAATPVEAFTERIRFSQTQAALDVVVKEIQTAIADGKMTKEDSAALKPAFLAKKQELQGVES